MPSKSNKPNNIKSLDQQPINIINEIDLQPGQSHTISDSPITLADPPAILIPFSKGNISRGFQYTPNSGIIGGTGTTNGAIPGFGTLSHLYQIVTGIDSTTGSSVQLFYTADLTCYGFIVGHPITYATIYLDVTINNAWTPVDADHYPYVALAVTGSSWNNMYQIIPETITSVAFLNGTTYSANTLNSGSQTAIPVSIEKGSKVAVICGFTTSTDTTSTAPITNQNLNFSGGIALY